MTDKKGIRSLFAIDVLPEEQEAQDRAKETIMQRLNVKPNELQAADDRYITPLPEIKFEPTFYQPTKTKEQLEEEKFKRDFEKEYGDEAIKKDILKKINANKRSGKRDYEGFSSSDMIVAEDIREKARAKLKHLQPKKDPTIQQQVINYSPKKVQPKMKKNFIGLKGGITPDQNHPDGFRINDDVDLYDVYGKSDMVRYIQEMAYKYDGTPITETVKPFNSYDKSSYPSDPAQQQALRTYGRAYDRLTPLQKKQIENNNKKNKPFTTIANNLGKK